ncbi:lipoyl(octanoyl) transferase LipB [Methylosarcina fibrata]|uniref:lipoyl(octanoyl) transferase LipB n=1 Tax=Methylosarcina fibrata TaxID=105972 RepID=UPI00037CD9E0|nr:lipoyl(octanoyl) transferase LipB [Methylosarcina fibrata]
MALTTRFLGIQDYQATWRAMQQFTENRTWDTPDEIWVVEHDPVYTLGLNGKREHLLDTGSIPVVHCDRGGQVTYHGPGQLVVYPLLDMKRSKLGVRPLVTLLEEAMIETLALYRIAANARADAPGVYVDGKKIGSIGIRIRKNCSYHGLSLNNYVDLSPFKGINPCGYSKLEVTRLADLGVNLSNEELASPLVEAITQALSS